jgi:DHA1 family multidrug resistance protein-like MFS transporter
VADAYFERIKKRPGFLLFLPVIAGFEFVRMALFITVLPGYLTQVLGFGKTLVGVVFAVNLLIDNLLKTPFGWLVDRKGPWPVLWFGSIGLAGGFILLLHANGPWTILMAALIIGMAVSPSWPGVIAGATRTLGEAYRGRAISTVSTAWLAAGGLGPVIAGWMIGDSQTAPTKAYPAAFVLLGSVVVFTVLVTSAASIINFKSANRELHPDAKDKAENQPHRWKLRAVLSDMAGGLPLIPGMLTQTLALGMLLPNLLPFAIAKFGMSESQYSLLLLIGGATTVLFMIPVGHLSDRFGPRPFLVAGFALAASTLFFIIGQRNIMTVFALVGFLGLAYALIQPSWNTLLAGVIPADRRGTAMGLFMAVEGIGMAIGPALGGLLGDLRPVLPFHISGGLLIVMSIVYLILPFPAYHKGGTA